MFGIIAIGLVAVATTAVFVAPWRLDVDVHQPADVPRASVRVSLRWLFLAWRLDGRHQARRAVRRAPPTTAMRQSAKGRLAPIRAALAVPGFPSRLWRLVIQIARQILPREVRVRARVGFDDPSDTGLFFAATRGSSWAASRVGWTIWIEPDFSGPVLEGDAHAGWSIRGVLLVWPLIAFLATPVVWRAGRAAMAARHRVV